MNISKAPQQHKEGHTVGLMNPMVDFPIARRASLMAEKIDAETGDDADVP